MRLPPSVVASSLFSLLALVFVEATEWPRSCYHRPRRPPAAPPDMLYANLPSAAQGSSSTDSLLPEPSALIAMLQLDQGRVMRVLEASSHSPEAVRRLAACVSGFRYEVHGQLVSSILQLPWRQSEALAAAVLEFALELVSAVPAFNKPVIDALVTTWLPAVTRKPVPRSGLSASRQLEAEAEAAAEAAARAADEATQPLVHATMRGILRACPLGIPNLFAAIKEHLPHRRLELSTHVTFVRNTLTMLKYCHALVGRVVHLLVERLVDLDVQIGQQLRALEEQADADDTIFEVESETTAEELAKMRQNAAKLDTLLSLLMAELIKPACTGPRSGGPGAAGRSGGYATSYASVCASGTGSAAAIATTGAGLTPAGQAVAAAARLAAELSQPNLKPASSTPLEATLEEADGSSRKLIEATLEEASKSEEPVLAGKLEPAADGSSVGGTASSSSSSSSGSIVGGSTTPPRSGLLPSADSFLRGVGSKSSSFPDLHSMAVTDAMTDDPDANPTPAAKVARTTGSSQASPGSSQAACASLALEPPADPAEALFEALVSAFRASVLPTYKCRCVQFLVFYVASFDAAFSRAFVHLLLSQLRSDHVHSEARMACAAYIASFLARAKFAEVDLALAAMRDIVQWASHYQQQAVARLAASGQQPSLDVHLHGVFYTALQGVLYILCYRHEQLTAAEGGGAIAGLGASLSEVLHGPLNPLKFCLEAIVLEFERLNVCDVATVVTNNERLVVASRTAGGGPNRLEDFFPFDPLNGFKAASALVAPIYQEWVHRRPHGDDGGPRDSNVSGLSQSEDASESLATSLQGMSVTPCSGDGIMGDHMRRRLAENRSRIAGGFSLSPQSAD